MIDLLKGTVTRRDWAFVGIVLAIAVLLGAFYYLLLYSPQQEKVMAMAAENKVLQDRLTKALNTKQNFEALQREAAVMEEIVAKFEERLPEKREIPLLLQGFESRASEIGLRVELSSLPPQTDPKKETIPYKVTAYGGFHQIVEFINQFERDRRYLKISDIDIEGQEDGQAEATFTLSTFRFIEAPAESQPQPGRTAP
jgi:Tfp pilus assembly protein PilO